jgi:hypothetical protein
MKATHYTHTSNKYGMFYRDEEYDTEQWYTLKKKIKHLIAKGYIQQFMKRDTCIEQGK